jgi:hypothetical protein
LIELLYLQGSIVDRFLSHDEWPSQPDYIFWGYFLSWLDRIQKDCGQGRFPVNCFEGEKATFRVCERSELGSLMSSPS